MATAAFRRAARRRTTRYAITAVGAAATISASALIVASSGAEAAARPHVKTVKVALILKDFTNPYFISMQNSAQADAAKLGVALQVSAGTSDGDTATQITAIDNAIADGDAGILITPNGNAVDPAIAQARKHHIFVIALDTVPIPASTVNLTFATNNFTAGQLIGQYAAKRLGGKAADIAMLDLFNNQVVSVDINRDHGFLAGMGISPGNANLNGSEAMSGNYKGQLGGSGTYKIACQLPTQGAVPGGQSSMETCLSKDPNINVVYAINEPAAEGAAAALKAAGKKGVIVVAIDGGCADIPFLKSGQISATSGQFPGKMAALGISSINTLVRTGKVPKASAGLDFYNTGTELYSNQPVAGVKSITTSAEAGICWQA